MLSLTFATALGTHVVLGLAQSAALLGGDYGRHSHGALIPIALAAATAAILAALLYGVHLIGEGPNSLPLLARAFQARVGWRTIALSSIAACLLLAAMETAEQLAAGRYDGFASAFGSLPAATLGIIVLFNAAGNTLLRELCAWLAGTHTKIVSALAVLLRRGHKSAAGSARRCNRAAFVAFRYACDILQVHGTRAPPSLAS
jgi:hypothetical protein